MDDVRGLEADRNGAGHIDAPAGDVDGPRLDIGADERRMHVRAYNHWVSLLHGRAYPAIDDLDPADVSDFGANGVLLDFSAGVENPAIAFVGRALREECAIDTSITHIAQVPSRSLLSRLTDHYLQIIANTAPIGFEAEFVNARGHNTLYRGILMPFSSHGESIDFIYGVINWKELVDDATQATLGDELAAAVRTGPAASAALAWADGPSGTLDADPYPTIPSAGATVVDHLALARASADVAQAAAATARDSLYDALQRAYAFAAAANADPHGYETLLRDAGVPLHLSAPMRPVVELVFGGGQDDARLAQYAAVLAYAHRGGVAVEGLRAFLERAEGGLDGIVRAERDARVDRS